MLIKKTFNFFPAASVLIEGGKMLPEKLSICQHRLAVVQSGRIVRKGILPPTLDP